ncbi:MAG TPA: peptidase S41 [Microscillaceae bacterium]|nr:peptidase S41 [Microscillaceae bacterium]
MRLFLCIALLSLSLVDQAFAQINARLFRYPDVSDKHICFVYAGDIWVVNKNGGTAQKLSSPQGEESFPRFSPDGNTIAFSGNYSGNNDVYTIPTNGGVPNRVTYHGFGDRVVNWHPNGQKILFASSRESGRQRYSQFYLIPRNGGFAQKLPLKQAEFGTFSPDGKKIAFTDRSRLFRTWKRYRGGMAADIYVFDQATSTSQNITNNASNDEVPMWKGNKIYYLSDRGVSKRFNIWVYDLASKQHSQLTKFKDYDVHFPSMGKNELVFEAGGRLYLMGFSDSQPKEVKVNITTDQRSLIKKQVKVGRWLQAADISPDGKRAVVQARGELFSVPAKEGFIKNLTSSSGVAERSPAWSPNGQYIAYWSDRSGEYELTLKDLTTQKEKKVTSLGKGYRYEIFWSPDSKKIAFINQAMLIKIVDVASGKVTQVDQGSGMLHGALQGFSVSWSADSRWIAYTSANDNNTSAIVLYDYQNKKRHRITSDFYGHSNPTFDPAGKYLYVTTQRSFSPMYSNYQNTFVYANATQIAAITLRKDVLSPLAPKNDEVKITKESGSKKGKGDQKSKGKAKGKSKTLEIDLDGIESRLVILPIRPGNYGNLKAVKGKLIYQQFPNTGSGGRQFPVKYFDLKSRKSKTIIKSANFFIVSANGKKMLVGQRNNAAIINVAPGQKIKKPLRTREMEAMVDPKAEWKQIFNDAWRLSRDYFYDSRMHGVNWNKVKSQYTKLLNDAVTRWDVNFVIGEMIGELNASHTYRGGGDQEFAQRKSVGYLGVDWEVANGHYRIKQIVKGAPWDAAARSPLAMPGMKVKAGDYVLAVNGIPLDINKEPYAAFQGLAGTTVELLINSQPSTQGAKTVIVKTMRGETRLRHLAWIEKNRQMVAKATNNEVGYVYVRSTGVDGQNELVRQFMGQWHKKGLIIDERFNSGGQIPDRFIELLNRKPLAFWAIRDGRDKTFQWPPVAHFGPKAMLINGWSGSGGDAFPDYFRKSKLGPLIGGRTWGGLIGISGAPQLIDGGVVTVPSFRMYHPDGKWFEEGYGVAPDIEVKENPGELAKGKDGQLQRAIDYIKKELKTYKNRPKPAASETRNK